MENKLFYMLKETARDEALSDHAFPVILYQLTDMFEKAHAISDWLGRDWNLFEKRQAMRQANQGDPGVYGVGLCLSSDYLPFCSSAVGLGLMIKCVDELFHRHMRIFEAYQTLTDVLYVKYPVYQEFRYFKASSQTLFPLPPSLHYWVEIKTIQALQYGLRLIECVCLLFYRIFEASLCGRDIYLILTSNPRAKLRACTELAVTILEHKEKLTADPDFLKTEMIKRQLLIDKILIKVGAKETSEWFIANLILEIAKQASQSIPTGIQTGQAIISPLWIPGKMQSLPLTPRFEEKIHSF